MLPRIFVEYVQSRRIDRFEWIELKNVNNEGEVITDTVD